MFLILGLATHRGLGTSPAERNAAADHGEPGQVNGAGARGPARHRGDGRVASGVREVGGCDCA